MFDKTYFVLSPIYHGAPLLSKLINAHPELTALGDTYPSNAFDQICGCGERVSQCPFWKAVKANVGAERYPHTRHTAYRKSGMAWLFQLIGVTPLTVAELRKYFGQNGILL